MKNENIVREELVEWITKPENEELLNTLNLMKEASSKGDWFDDLTEEEKQSIERGQKDHQKGHTLNSKDFWAKHG